MTNDTDQRAARWTRIDLEPEALHDLGHRISRLADERERG